MMRLLRRGRSDQSSLLRELRLAFDADDHPRLAQLISGHQGEILQVFSSWWPPQDPSAWDPADLDRYNHAMAFVANVFALNLGRPELMARMLGDRPDDRFVAALGHDRTIDELVKAGRYAEGEAAAQAFVAQVEQWDADFAPDLRALAWLTLGNVRYDAGSPTSAIEPLEHAASIMTAHGDTEAVSLSARRLFDAYRHIGDAASAATWLERSLEAADVRREPDVPWLRRELEIVRAGEPLVRIVGAIGDRHFEVDDLAAALEESGGSRAHVRFEYFRNRPTLRAASRATAEGTRLAASRRLGEALAEFTTASAIDPFDPSPHYNAGVALLELGRFVEARRSFESTESLAPGWHFCRRYAWLARAIVDGEVSEGVARALIGTSSDESPPAERRRLLGPALADAPNLGWLCLNQANADMSDGRRAAAEDWVRRGLEGNADADVRSSLLLRLAMIEGFASKEGRRLACEAIALDGCLLERAVALVSVSEPQRRGAPGTGRDASH